MTATAYAQTTPPCPKCGGPMYDETKSKFWDPSKNRPIAKCKNKGVCDGAVWAPKTTTTTTRAPQPVVAHINPASGDLPGDPESAYAPLPQHQPVTPPQVALTAAQKALYAECVDHARQVAGLLLPNASPDTIAAMGATLYIQANNRRGL